MKRITAIVLITFLLTPSFAFATKDFLGAPIIPGAKIVNKTHKRLELVVNKNHDEVIAFYKRALKGLKDIRYREWEKASYIEDDSNRPWHSITISKAKGNKTLIVIMKDSWSWIMGTLILRFVGVFVVLLVLFIALSVSGAIISRIVGSEDKEKAKT